jgi:RNA polymerase sigma-70 factor (ECF subfamily)
MMRFQRPPRPEPSGLAERFRLRMLPHLDAAHRFARFLSRDAGLAEEIVQDGYLRAYRAFAAYRGEADRAWLFAILRNCWRDRARAAGPALESIDPDGLADDWTPEALLQRQCTIASVRDAIEALPLAFREVIVLRELEEMPYREIAALVDVPIGTVMSRLARGRQLLAGLLRGLETEEPSR